MTEQKKTTRGSDEARAWATGLAQHFGEAVHFYRTRLELSAVQLSARTREIGYPITRGTIAKIEGNHRNGKMDVAEVLTLSAALEVAPVDLIFPRYPSFATDMTPRFTSHAAMAGAWLSASQDYRPFGQPNSPRAEQSQALRQKLEGVLLGISDFEKNIKFDSQGIPIASSMSKDEAETIVSDLKLAKIDIERMGGSFGGTSWEHHLEEFLDDPKTEWLPF